MPAQTVMQVRRDSATNWSSANPVLANGEMGYDTTNKLFKVGDGSTAWNSLKVMAQHNTGSAARPLLTDGAYLSGSGLVLSGLSGNNASAPDSAALSITGDIDIKVKVAMTDWTPTGNQTLVGKNASGQFSYAFRVLTTGALQLQWSTDGTTVLNHGSTTATGFTDGATKWVRVTMDVNDGSGNRVVKFYTSDNGTTWSSLATVTTAGTTSIFDGTSVVGVGADSSTSSGMVAGTIYDVVIQSAYDTTDNTTSLVFDANFETATADALAFTESSANAATVTINTTRYNYSIPNVQLYATTTALDSADLSRFNVFVVNKAVMVDLAAFEVTTGPASNSTMKMAVYNADDDFQPVGAPVIDFGSVTVTTSATGVFTKQITAVTLQPGSYLVGYNMSVAMTLRYYRGGLGWVRSTMGTSPFNTGYMIDQANSVFPSSSFKWQRYNLGSTTNLHAVMLRWKAA